MKRLLTILLLLLALTSGAQNIQLTGKILHQESDTILVQAWHQGRLVAEQYRTDPFYTLTLGSLPYYDIKITSGSRSKHCYLICWNMSFELIQLDIDFSSSQSVVVYKERKSANYYTLLLYGVGQVRNREIKIHEAK